MKSRWLGIYLGAVVYAFIAMVAAREFVIPRTLPSINGHISGDPQLYFRLAKAQAQNIKENGFGAFTLRPEGQGPAGIASLHYLIFDGTYSVVLVNALLHGVSVILMMLVLMQWFTFRISLISVIPLLLSPYMMPWFSQINKDSFVLTGVLFVVYGWLRLMKEREIAKGVMYFSYATIGIALIWIMRPYLNQLMLFFFLMAYAIHILYLIGKGAWRGGCGVRFGIFELSVFDPKFNFYIFLVFGGLILALLSLSNHGAASDKTLDRLAHEPSSFHTANKSLSNICLSKIDPKIWKRDEYIPIWIDGKLRSLVGQRCLTFQILDTHKNITTLNSIVDKDRLPAGFWEAASYSVRAMFLGVFSPWPDRWDYIFTENFSFFYLLAPIEAILLYVGILGLLRWIYKSLAYSALVPVLFSVTAMTIYGMTTPLLGALYRYRYPWWIMLICLGLAALLTLNRGYRQINISGG